MKHYLLSIQQPVGGAPAPEIIEPIMRDVTAFNEELKEAGGWVFAGGLHEPSASTVVRHDGDQPLITDGPYVEGKEHVGGVTILAAADLDEALGWAQKLSKATTLPIEVRPFQGEAAEHLK